MTRPEKIAALLPYVRDLADRLLLKDWTIAIGDLSADPGNRAEIFPCEGQHHATIYLGHEFFDQPPEERRKILCHELIHCHLDPAFRVASRGMDDERKADFRMLIEYAVEDLARAMAPHMPAPDGEGSR